MFETGSPGKGKSLSDRRLDIEDLVVQAQRGDSEAEKRLFGHLAARFRVILYHQIQNQDEVEDIMQDALAAIARDYKTLQIQSSFAGWAVRVLQNRLLAFLRTRQTNRKRFADVDANEAWYASESVSAELRTDLLDCVRKLCRANIRYARILVLSFQGFKVDEVCQRLGVTKTNAYSLLSRSRSLLQLCLETGRVSS